MKFPNPFVLDPRDPIAALCLGSQLGAHFLVEWLLHREAAKERATARREGRPAATGLDTGRIHREVHRCFTRALRSLRGEGAE